MQHGKVDGSSAEVSPLSYFIENPDAPTEEELHKFCLFIQETCHHVFKELDIHVTKHLPLNTSNKITKTLSFSNNNFTNDTEKYSGVLRDMFKTEGNKVLYFTKRSPKDSYKKLNPQSTSIELFVPLDQEKDKQFTLLFEYYTLGN